MLFRIIISGLTLLTCSTLYSQDPSTNYSKILPIKVCGGWTLGTIGGGILDTTQFFDELSDLQRDNAYCEYGTGFGGLYQFRDSSGYGIIDDSGIVLQSNSIKPFETLECYFLVKTNTDGKYLLNDDLVQIAGPYDEYKLIDGLIRVRKGDKYGTLRMAFNGETGQYEIQKVFRVEYDMIGNWGTGYLAIKNNKLNYFNESYEQLPGSWDHIMPVLDQPLIQVWNQNKFYYYHDHELFKLHGENDSIVLLPYGYYKVLHNHGVSLYRTESNELVTTYSNLNCTPISKEYLAVFNDSLVGLANKNGQILFQPKFENLIRPGDTPWSLSNAARTTNLFIATRNNKQGLVNEKGEIVIPLEYDRILEHRANQLMCYQLLKQNRFGFANSEGEIVLETKYQGVRNFIYDVILVQNNNLFGLYNMSDRRFITGIDYNDVDYENSYFILRNGAWLTAANADSIIIRNCQNIRAANGVVKCYVEEKLMVAEADDNGWNKYIYNDVPSYDIQKYTRDNVRVAINGPASSYFYFDVVSESWGMKNTYNNNFNVKPYAHRVTYTESGELFAIESPQLKSFTIDNQNFIPQYSFKNIGNGNTFVTSSYVIGSHGRASDDLDHGMHMFYSKENHFQFDSWDIDKKITYAIKDDQTGVCRFNTGGSLHLTKSENDEPYSNYFKRLNYGCNLIPHNIDGYKTILEDELSVQIRDGDWFLYTLRPYDADEWFWKGQKAYQGVRPAGNHYMHRKGSHYGMISYKHQFDVPTQYDTLIMMKPQSIFKFSVQNEKHLMVDISSGDTVMMFDKVLFVGKDHMQVKIGNQYVLLNDAGKKVYTDSIPYAFIGNNHIYYKRNNHVDVRTLKGDSVLFAKGSSVLKQKSENIFEVVNNGTVVLFNTGNNIICGLTDGKLTRYGNNLVFSGDKMSYVLDIKGVIVDNLQSDNITALKNNMILVKLTKGYRIYNVNEQKYRSRFLDISAIYDSVFVAREKKGYSVYNFDNERILNGVKQFGDSRENYFTILTESGWVLYDIDNGYQMEVDDDMFVVSDNEIFVVSNTEYVKLETVERQDSRYEITGKNRHYYLEDKSGNRLLSESFQHIRLFQNFIVVPDKPLWGVISGYENRLVVEPEYEQVDNCGNLLFRLYQGEDIYFQNVKEDRIKPQCYMSK